MNSTKLFLCCSLWAAAGGGWAQTRVDLRTQGKSIDFSAAGATLPSQTGTQLPSVCKTGQTFIKTDAAPMPAWYLCGPDNQWNTSDAAYKGSANTYASGARQTFVGSTSGAGIQIAPGTLPVLPQVGDLAADAGDSNRLKFFDGQSWFDLNLGPLGNYHATFNSQTSLAIPGAAHQLGTADLLVQCYDNAVPANVMEPSAISVDPNSYDVTIVFPAAASGRCVLNGTNRGGGGGGSGAGMSARLGDLAAQRASANTLTVGTNCSVVSPCNARFGNRVVAITGSASVVLASPAANGTAYIYLDASGTLFAGSTMALTCSAGCAVAAGVAGFPANTIPLSTWTATNGSWDVTGGTDERGWLSATPLAGGTGVALTLAGGQTTVAVDTALVPAYLTALATLDFPAIPAGRCSADLTIALPGANPGDSVVPGWPAGLEAGLSGTMRVSAAGTVAVRLCADGSGPVDPAAEAFRATIVRSF